MNATIIANATVALVPDGPGRFALFLHAEQPGDGTPAMLLRIQGLKAEICPPPMAAELGPQIEAAAAKQQVRLAEAAAAAI